MRNADAVEDQDSVVDHRSLRQVAAGDMKAGKKAKARTGPERSQKASGDFSTSDAAGGKRDEMTKTMYKGS